MKKWIVPAVALSLLCANVGYAASSVDVGVEKPVKTVDVNVGETVDVKVQKLFKVIGVDVTKDGVTVLVNRPLKKVEVVVEDGVPVVRITYKLTGRVLEITDFGLMRAILGLFG